MNKSLYLVLLYLIVIPTQATFIGTFTDSQSAHNSINPEIGTAANLLAKGKIEEAKELFESVLKQSPNETGAILGLADIAYAKKQPEQVEILILRALKIAPNNAAVQTAVGRFRYLKGDYNSAITHFKKAIQLDKTIPDPEIELASLYISNLNDPASAAAHYRRAVELNPQNINVLYAYASVLSSLDRLEDAILQLDIATKLKPDSAYTYQLKSTILAAHGKTNSALDALNTALKIEPNNVNSMLAKAELLFVTNKHNDSLSEYQKILSINPEHALALTKLGLLHQIKGDFPLAEKLYKRAIKADSTIAMAYNNLAYGTASIAGRGKEAINWAKQAIKLQPNNPEFQDTLAMAYLSTGELANAQRTLESLVKKHPNFLEGKYNLARLYDKAGDTNRAVPLYKSILQQSDDYPNNKNIRDRLSQLGS